VLRSLSLLPEPVAPVAPGSATAGAAPDDAQPAAPADAPPDAPIVIDGGVEFQPAPVPTTSPVGPCPRGAATADR
jgi:hypothetical protein